jgi:hypothetical protein
LLFSRSVTEAGLLSTLCLGAETMQGTIPRLIPTETSTVDGLLGRHPSNEPKARWCIFRQLPGKVFVCRNPDIDRLGLNILYPGIAG